MSSVPQFNADLDRDEPEEKKEKEERIEKPRAWS